MGDRRPLRVARRRSLKGEREIEVYTPGEVPVEAEPPRARIVGAGDVLVRREHERLLRPLRVPVHQEMSSRAGNREFRVCLTALKRPIVQNGNVGHVDHRVTASHYREVIRNGVDAVERDRARATLASARELHVPPNTDGRRRLTKIGHGSAAHTVIQTALARVQDSSRHESRLASIGRVAVKDPILRGALELTAHSGARCRAILCAVASVVEAETLRYIHRTVVNGIAEACTSHRSPLPAVLPGQPVVPSSRPAAPTVETKFRIPLNTLPFINVLS